MTLESIFLIFIISALILILIYEVVFVLFFKNNSVSESGKEGETDVIFQPRPLGYSAPPAGKIQQCNTPVFVLPDEVQCTEMEVDGVKEEVKVPLAQKNPQNSSVKAPTIVVSSPTF